MSLILNKNMGLLGNRTHPVDVLFVFPVPSRFSPEKFVALGILYPNSAAEKAGYKTEVHDCRFEPESELIKKIDRAKCIAISTMSGSQLLECIRISEMTRNLNPMARIIWGGAHPTIAKTECLDESFVDYVIVSEGETRVVKLLNHIFHEAPIESVDGICYLKDGQPFEQPAHKTMRLDEEYVSPITPTTEKYFEMSVPMLPSRRGCNWRCSFCSVPFQFLGRNSREIPYPQWEEDCGRMLDLWERKNPKLEVFELNDENAQHANAMKPYMQFLNNRGIKSHLHIRSDALLRKENVQLFKEYGCARVHNGLESGNERVLKNVYLKDCTPDVFRQAAQNLKEVGIFGVFTAVLGAPTETREEMFDTLDLLDELDDMLNPSPGMRATCYTLIALKGTTIYDVCKREGWKLPTTTREWSQYSAANNPESTYTSNIFWLSGLKFNRHPGGKTDRNFGKHRWMLAPFEKLAIWRHNHRKYGWFGVERFFIEKLISWKAKGQRDHDIVMSESLSAGVVKTGW